MGAARHKSVVAALGEALLVLPEQCRPTPVWRLRRMEVVGVAAGCAGQRVVQERPVHAEHARVQVQAVAMEGALLEVWMGSDPARSAWRGVMPL